MNRWVLAMSALVLALGLGTPEPLESMPNRIPTAAPAEVGLDAKKLDRIDVVVREAIDHGELLAHPARHKKKSHPILRFRCVSAPCLPW